MAEKESTLRAFATVLILALVCSILVAGAAVGLRERQEFNQRLDQQKNILQAAGLYREGADVEQLFAAVEARIIRLADGQLLPSSEIDPARFDQLKAAFDPVGGRILERGEDGAGIGRLEKHSLVYLVREAGELQTVILPIRGKGLWSTMYGYVALAPDLNTVGGVTFYRHGETPGLGGEIENPRWLAAWRGKKIYDQRQQPTLRAVKGAAAAGEAGIHQLDGISGATLTLEGVSKLLEFWFGEHGFKPFLERYRGGNFPAAAQEEALPEATKGSMER